jgi:putative FmdB family regulatory protein
MPIYEYKCQQCGAHYEERQSVSDAPLTTCEKCHGKLEKQWSLSGFQFKGGGWYVTDYAGGNKSGEKGEKGEKSSGGDSTASAESASKPKDDSKPAKTADSTGKSD